MTLETYEKMMMAYEALSEFKDEDTFPFKDELLGHLEQWFVHYSEEVEVLCLRSLRLQADEKIRDAMQALLLYDGHLPTIRNFELETCMNAWLQHSEKIEKEKLESGKKD